MTALLWTLVAAGALNTVSALISGCYEEVPRWARVASAVWECAIGCWALVLLIKGGAF